ncbi:MAG: hypothetical protein HRU04_08660 [Oceanospirillaceae bacterium]|nr:hypothetical protein [Oceanospirillaceae bacterium]
MAVKKGISKTNLNTLCFHAGRIEDKVWGGLASPIINSTAYRYREIQNRGYPRYFEAPFRADR